MHEEVLTPGSRDVLAKLEGISLPELHGWTLAGGTGLALMLGHRISDDFDFFRKDPIDLHKLLNGVMNNFDSETLQHENHTLTVLLNSVKLSFFIVESPFLFSSTPYAFFTIADIRDIAIMKIAAIAGRGSRKDFIDLFFLLKENITLNECIAFFTEKHRDSGYNLYHIMKSLTWFEDAESEPEPQMLKDFSWEKCKEFFVHESKNMVLPPPSD
jgi:hypothetical protein